MYALTRIKQHGRAVLLSFHYPLSFIHLSFSPGLPLLGTSKCSNILPVCQRGEAIKFYTFDELTYDLYRQVARERFGWEAGYDNFVGARLLHVAETNEQAIAEASHTPMREKRETFQRIVRDFLMGQEEELERESMVKV